MLDAEYCERSSSLGLVDSGGAMLDAFIQWARHSEVITKINLRVREDNERARKLYESRGFELEGTIRRDFVVDGHYYDHHLMGLIL